MFALRVSRLVTKPITTTLTCVRGFQITNAPIDDSPWLNPGANRTKEEVFSINHGLMRAIFLNRPKQLNALNLNMINYIQPRLEGADANPRCTSVVVCGTGDKAFCAGGDVVALYKAGKSGGDTSTFFWREYTLNHLISKLNVAYIAILNGITMGGGVGLSVHGKYRLATENTLFAMPETGIGFFPDVGGSYFLPRLRGQMGMYLALTGARLRGADVYHAGIATHYMAAESIPQFYERYNELLGGSISVDQHITSLALTHPELPSFTLEPHLSAIDECFSGNSVEEIIEALKAHDTDWSKQTLKVLSRASPTSLKVTFKQIRQGSALPIEDCFNMEYRISQRFMKPGSDFYEGVRAQLVDGDKKPQWNPSRLEDVSNDLVDEYFAPAKRELLLGYLAEDKQNKQQQQQQPDNNTTSSTTTTATTKITTSNKKQM